jgi:hypothetical protein
MELFMTLRVCSGKKMYKELYIMDVGFIITRCVHFQHHNVLLNECVSCIRSFYPSNLIVIIDDYSSIDIDTSSMTNVIVEKSEVSKGCGELLPYIYLHKNKYFEKAVILHDSVFINSVLDTNTTTVQYLWSFGEHEPYYRVYTEFLLSLLHIDTEVYIKKEWQDQGCFGTMSVITLSFLTELFDMFPLHILTPYITIRVHRMCLERVFAICCFLFFKKKSELLQPSLYGSIVEYMPYGTTYDEYIQNKEHYKSTYPIIKVWVTR